MGGAEITAEDVATLTFPEDLDDKAILVPVDVSGAGKDFPVMHEEMVEKLGAQAAVQAIVDAAALFKKNSKKNFTDENRPIEMTVGDWRAEAGMDDADDEEDEEEPEGEEEEEEAADDDEEE